MAEPVAAPPRPRRLVTLASVLVDIVLDLPHVPQAGMDVLAREVVTGPGGAFNVMVAARRLGLPTAYGGPHGKGRFGDLVRAGLRREGVRALSAPDPTEDTGYCITLVDARAERTFISVNGADARMRAGDLAAVQHRKGDAVYASGYDLAYALSGPVLAANLGSLPAASLLVVDPGPLIDDVPPGRWQRLLPRVDVLTMNEREARSLPRLRPHLRDDAVVIVRQGARGAVLDVGRSPSTIVAGVPVEAVDTTGAGDTHVGAMLAALAQGQPWPAAVEVANAAAAYSVTRRGGASGPTVEQLRAFWDTRR